MLQVHPAERRSEKARAEAERDGKTTAKVTTTNDSVDPLGLSSSSPFHRTENLASPAGSAWSVSCALPRPPLADTRPRCAAFTPFPPLPLPSRGLIRLQIVDSTFDPQQASSRSLARDAPRRSTGAPRPPRSSSAGAGGGPPNSPTRRTEGLRSRARDRSAEFARLSLTLHASGVHGAFSGPGRGPSPRARAAFRPAGPRSRPRVSPARRRPFPRERDQSCPPGRPSAQARGLPGRPRWEHPADRTRSRSVFVRQRRFCRGARSVARIKSPGRPVRGAFAPGRGEGDAESRAGGTSEAPRLSRGTAQR